LAGQKHGDPVEPPQRSFGDAQSLEEREYVDWWLGREWRRHKSADNLAGDGRFKESAEPTVGGRDLNHAVNHGRWALLKQFGFGLNKTSAKVGTLN
jgi:hypothetical protein